MADGREEYFRGGRAALLLCAALSSAFLLQLAKNLHFICGIKPLEQFIKGGAFFFVRVAEVDRESDFATGVHFYCSNRLTITCDSVPCGSAIICNAFDGAAHDTVEMSRNVNEACGGHNGICPELSILGRYKHTAVIDKIKRLGVAVIFFKVREIYGKEGGAGTIGFCQNFYNLFPNGYFIGINTVVWFPIFNSLVYLVNRLINIGYGVIFSQAP